MSDRRILTVGHSTHPIDEFLTLLSGADVEVVADVRRLPGSNKYPWFDQDALSVSLGEHGIRYLRIAELTGRRPLQHGVPAAVDALWHNRSFHNYADYALGLDFARGLEELIRLGDEAQVAVMCAEAVWWRCHRRIIADHLLARGIRVGHLMADGVVTTAELTPGAVAHDGMVEYPAGAPQA